MKNQLNLAMIDARGLMRLLKMVESNRVSAE